MKMKYRLYLQRIIIVILIALLAAVLLKRNNEGFSSDVAKGQYDAGDGQEPEQSTEQDESNEVKEPNESKEAKESNESKESKQPKENEGTGEDNAKKVMALGISDYRKLSIDPLAPENYEGNALKTRLKELAALDEAYKEVYENYDMYPESILSAFCNEPGMSGFVLGYTDERKNEKPEYTEEELNDEFPLLLQWDKRWGYEDYGDSCIGTAGCAPVCMAMVALSLTSDEDVTPDVIAKYAMEKGYYLRGTGTSWNFLTDGARHFGFYGRELGLNESAVLSELREGHPVICSMRPGKFTARGHFIVLAGIQDGKIIVKDPNSAYRSSLLWDFSDIWYQIKNMWVYTKESVGYQTQPSYGYGSQGDYEVIYDVRE